MNQYSYFPVYLLLIATIFWASFAQAVSKNGFVLDDASIPSREILQGGPPRDGIPAIDQPVFVSHDEADFLDAQDRVLGVVINNVAKAYPIKILDWHEIVNDKIGKQYFVVTYCPLCGTGVVFAANVENKFLKFGVSGLLYNSDVLLYDRNTESLWSQIMGEAISGELKGLKLPRIPVFHTTWGDWKRKHPQSLVLSMDTGTRRNYSNSPYKGYEQSRRLYFSVSNIAPRTYHPKEQVMGIEVEGMFKAYPFKELSNNGSSNFIDELGGEKLKVHWDETSRSAYITDINNDVLVTTTAFWFAWYTFHPDTEVFKASNE